MKAKRKCAHSGGSIIKKSKIYECANLDAQAHNRCVEMTMKQVDAVLIIWNESVHKELNFANFEDKFFPSTDQGETLHTAP